MSEKTSVQLDAYFSAFVERQVEDGYYASADEVVLAGLRLLEESNARKLEALRAAIEEGQRSGRAEDFDFDDFLAGKRLSRSA